MYFTVWSFVSELARKVPGFCLPGADATWVNGGFAAGSSKLTGTFRLTVDVYVRGTPAGWPGRGGRIKVRPYGKVYNVYEKGGGEDGKAGGKDVAGPRTSAVMKPGAGRAA